MLLHMYSFSQPALREKLARVTALASGGDGPQSTCYVCATEKCGYSAAHLLELEWRGTGTHAGDTPVVSAQDGAFARVSREEMLPAGIA